MRTQEWGVDWHQQGRPERGAQIFLDRRRCVLCETRAALPGATHCGRCRAWVARLARDEAAGRAFTRRFWRVCAIGQIAFWVLALVLLANGCDVAALRP